MNWNAVKHVSKAIVGAVVTFISNLLIHMTGDEGFADVTLVQWLLTVVSTAAAYGLVWKATNAPLNDAPDGKHEARRIDDWPH